MILYQCELNWLEFVRVTGEMQRSLPASNSVESMLIAFAARLPSFNLKECELYVIEKSRQVYNLTKQRNEKEDDIDNGIILSESDCEDLHELSAIKDPLDDKGKEVLRRKRAFLKRKATREIKKRIAERRFLQRRRSKKVKRLEDECPDIGTTIEEFVRKRGVGADAWRRTGVLTFDGNRKLGKKVTFRTIQAHLEAKYHRKISYGNVVQLCIPRNKRRKSAARYKGLAKVTQRRARKGFTLKYNPDSHWSAALYRGLDYIQYKDGTHIMNVGRDDQAGFRLDTLSTNKQFGTLTLKDHVSTTTRTDYMNPYPSVLQTTSYNFPSTETTNEICGGVVKAKKLFNKNPAQHYADMLMLEKHEDIKQAFLNPRTGKQKDIECIRVDGGGDEGPVHEEVQYWWTKRHLLKQTKAMMVSTRSSGSSYKNRVELQNGCLSLGHANLFIPSTLNGSCIISGKVNDEMLCKNLDSAIDVYLSRVDKSPCAKTVIHLTKGANSDDEQKEREIVIKCLKGKAEDKKQAKLQYPDLYKNIESIWQLRQRHMVKGLPVQYVFYLRCCYSPQCIHPLCRSGVSVDEFWYPDGPSLDFSLHPRLIQNARLATSIVKIVMGFVQVTI